jgi:hypothetical protein
VVEADPIVVPTGKVVCSFLLISGAFGVGILFPGEEENGADECGWVAQVSLLRPGFLLANVSSPERPGLESET